MKYGFKFKHAEDNEFRVAEFATRKEAEEKWAELAEEPDYQLGAINEIS